MNELGQTIIENYNTFAPKICSQSGLRICYNHLPLLSLGFLYINTLIIVIKRLLNELDSKSEWRKTLFIIGGNSTVTLDDVYQFRTALRFNFKTMGTISIKRKAKKKALVISLTI